MSHKAQEPAREQAVDIAAATNSYNQASLMSLRDYLAQSAEVMERAAAAISQSTMEAAIDCIVAALSADRPLLVCGNGGSAADAMHIAGELVARFLRDRRAFRVICLSESPVVLTAWSNDVTFETVFARQVEAYGGEGAVLLGLSTSGTSRNVVAAFEQARRMRMQTIALTGEGGGTLAPLTYFLLPVPSRRTPLIQQVHLCLYHYICEHVERRLAEI
jgi:D-sedoheptulose 7-phosphate isomerase